MDQYQSVSTSSRMREHGKGPAMKFKREDWFLHLSTTGEQVCPLNQPSLTQNHLCLPGSLSRCKRGTKLKNKLYMATQFNTCEWNQTWCWGSQCGLDQPGC